VNADGSLDRHIQSDPPGADREANWLPIAKAPFTLLMWLYSPKAEFLNGDWVPAGETSELINAVGVPV
jgi:hypothetical protein